MAEQRGTEYFHAPYKFTGKELDEETGLYYYGARYYDPKTSIWLSVDPLAEKFPNMSPYIYTFNNPINFIDPTGMEPEEGGGGGGEPKKTTFTYTLDYKTSESSIPFGDTFNYLIGSYTEVLKSGTISNFVNGDTNGGYEVTLKVPSVSPWDRDNPSYATYIGRGSDLNNLNFTKEKSLAQTFVDGFNTGWKVGLSNEMNASLTTAIFNRTIKGLSVLGKYPAYTNLANVLNARRFQISAKVWNKMTPDQQWAANTKFLDRIIKRGDAIFLATPVKNINKVGGYFRRELDYMIEKGYKLSKDGLKLYKD